MSTPFVRRLVKHDTPAQCRGTYACPDLWEMEDGDFAVIGEDITDLADQLPAGSRCGSNERIVRVPRHLLIEAKPQIPGTAQP